MWTFLRLFYIIYFFNLGKITRSQIIIYSRTLNRCSQKLIFRIFCPQMMPNDISGLWILCPQFTDRSNHTVWILCPRSGNIVGHHMRTKNWKNQFCLVHTLWSIIPIIMGKSYNKWESQFYPLFFDWPFYPRQFYPRKTEFLQKVNFIHFWKICSKYRFIHFICKWNVNSLVSSNKSF